MSKATLYINNLNEKPSINTTKRELHTRFRKYGDIISLIIKKKVSLKGQLFITYKDISSSTRAQKELNGTKVLDNVINVSFAKEDSIAHYKSALSENEFHEFIRERSKKRKLDDSNDRNDKRKKIKLIKSKTPNKTLLLQNLSATISKEELVGFFNKFDGFIDLRLIKVKKLSFIEFNDIESAQKVMNLYSEGNIQDFVNDEGDSSFITFAK